ncbi:MAG: efflux RND transporter periplasmic adaptor subunit [Chloroflexota bacterium]
MKKIILAFTLTLILTACGQASSPTPIPTLVLDAGASDSGTAAPVTGGVVAASAEVRPAEFVELGFPLLGAVASVDVETGDSVAAGQALAALDPTLQQARVAEAEANIDAAEAQLAYLVRSGASQDQLDSAQADIDRATALADQARATLAQATLYTPIAGTVVSVDIAAGETANPGQVVIVVADLGHMRIETTDLSERDVPTVQVGQPASVFIDALDESFQGKVTDIARQSETVGGDVTYEVTIELDGQPAGLRWGMTAEVEIQTEQ